MDKHRATFDLMATLHASRKWFDGNMARRFMGFVCSADALQLSIISATSFQWFPFDPVSSIPFWTWTSDDPCVKGKHLLILQYLEHTPTLWGMLQCFGHVRNWLKTRNSRKDSYMPADLTRPAAASVTRLYPRGRSRDPRVVAWFGSSNLILLVARREQG